MAKVKIQGHASGTGVLTVTAPNTSTDRTITLPDSTGTLATTADSVGGATGVDFNDNVKARFGTGNDLEIYHSGNDSIISDTTSVRRLLIQGNDVTIRNADSSKDAAKFNNGGSVDLYHNNAVKLATTATGIAVTGGVAIGGTGTANTLDDYEEGTWTPSINDGSPTYTTTYARTGVYTKIGNVVYLYMELYMGAISFGDATQTLVFSGLPFASRSTGDTFGMGMASSVTWSSIYTNGSTYNTGSMADASILHASPTILSNSSVFRISLSGKSNIGRSYLKNAAFHNGSGMAIGLTYHTA